MSLLVVGLSHRSAPVELLERTSLGPEHVGKLVADVASADHIGEAVVVSTCNRVEVYADAAKFHAGVAEITSLLADHTGVAHDELTAHLYVHYEDRAVAHLFSVASGLDSMVVGEGQILGQVRTALRAAQEAGAAGRLLNEAFQQALRVGKRVHADTDIDRAGASLVSVGLEHAGRSLGDLSGRSALVVGAGSMSALAATTLVRGGIGELVVANRTFERGVDLAARLGGRAIRLEQLEEELPGADLVLSCTGALALLVTAPAVTRARAVRGPRPQFFLDLALPRDIDPDIAELSGVRLLDLAGLGRMLAGDERAADVEAVKAIVTEEVAGFLGWLRASAVAPTVVALRAMAEQVVDAELTRLAGRLPSMDEHTREEVSQAVHRVVDKLLHAPTVRVKQLAGEPGGQGYAQALRELFDLDPVRVEAVTRPELDGELA